MSPLAMLILELTLKYGPTFVSELVKVCHKENPTLAEWNAAFDLAKNPIVQVSDVPKFKAEDLAAALKTVGDAVAKASFDSPDGKLPPDGRG